MAEAVFESQLVEAGLGGQVGVLSAGTGNWHRGESADQRAHASLDRGGYAAFEHRARQFDPGWFDQLDLVLALDRTHDRALKKLATSDADRDKVRLFLAFSPEQSGVLDVPDPYYSDDHAFDRVLAMIEQTSRSLVRHVREELASR